MNYRFDHGAEGASFVPAALLYEPEKSSYGFLAESNRAEYQRLAIAELNSAFDKVYWLRDFFKTEIVQDEDGCYVDYDDQGDIPLTFVTDVPHEGNYLVNVSLKAAEDAEVLVFLGRRRLAARLKLKAGETAEVSGIANICPIVPRTYEDPMEDLTLDVTVIGRGVHLCAVSAEEWQGPTIYIAGDSTVTDQSADYPYLPGNSYCGWGQMLSAYLGAQAAVSNHAHSGLTTESFRSEKHYDILIDRIQAGDICLFQFGHNDQKLDHLLAEGGYRENLIQYIEEIRAKGAIPVIITPMARNSWKGGNGEYNDLLEGYATACIRLGADMNVPVLKLHEKTLSLVTSLGREAAKRYFFPSDYTHSNDYGAYLFAQYVFEELCETGVLAGFDIEACPKTIDWNPPEVLPQLVIPEMFAHVENPFEEQLFADLERPEELVTRADALDFIIKTMHFFPTNVYNDMFTDVIGHETYAGTVECAWQNGLIPESFIENQTLQPLKQVTGTEFLTLLLGGYQSRKDLPAGETVVEQARALGLIDEAFDALKLLTRAQAADMCKLLKI